MPRLVQVLDRGADRVGRCGTQTKLGLGSYAISKRRKAVSP